MSIQCNFLRRYINLKVYHTYNFVDPSFGAHTQNVESMCGRAKRRNKNENETAVNLHDFHLHEFMWRKCIVEICWLYYNAQ